MAECVSENISLSDHLKSQCIYLSVYRLHISVYTPCVSVRMRACVYMCMFVCVYVCVCMYMCLFTRVCMCVCF